MKATKSMIAESKRSTKRAKKVIQFGDKITRIMCGASSGTFTFTHWDGDWLCGAKVRDCHASHIYKVNGKNATFYNEGKRK